MHKLTFKILETFKQYRSDICHDVLAEDVVLENADDAFSMDWDINGFHAKLGVKKQ